MNSSYKENNYGLVFQSVAWLTNPRRVVELGALNGYSTSHLIRGLTRLRREVRLDVVDLWEDYEYNSCSLDLFKENVIDYVGDFGLVDVSFIKEDCFNISNLYDDNSIDLLHLDISNDGDKIRRFLDVWMPKMAYNSVVMVEGGSQERDRVEWMFKYNKLPMNSILADMDSIILPDFPSLTLIRITK